MELKTNRYFNLTLVFVHIVIGGFMMSRNFSKAFGLLILLIAIFNIFKSKNKNEEVLKWTMYFISLEVLLRMTKGHISWEIVKYITILFFTLGLIIEERKHSVPVVFLIYVFLLSLGIVFTNIPAGESLRNAIVFNLSGPIVLGFSAIYFFKRIISFERIKECLFYSLLPILSMISFLYFKTPSLKEIAFNGSANFSSSGGFGPNQVATALGYGMFLLGVLLMIKQKITGFVLLDAFLLLYITYRGLLTFSRGGMITGFVAFFIFSFFYILSKRQTKSFFKYILIITVGLSTIWIYSTNVTGGMLENRYLGKNANGDIKEDISSGRIDIFEKQFDNFLENPFFGIGVGSGKYDRLEKYNGNITGASHNEFSRLLEEHGLIGVFALLLLFLSTYSNYRKQPFYFKGFILAFAVLWFLTINHSAMRIAFPGFIYGMSLINIKEEND